MMLPISIENVCAKELRRAENAKAEQEIRAQIMDALTSAPIVLNSALHSGGKTLRGCLKFVGEHFEICAACCSRRERQLTTVRRRFQHQFFQRLLGMTQENEQLLKYLFFI